MMNESEYKKLVDELNKASDAYYNSNIPIMSDAEFDDKVDLLKEFESTTGIIDPNSPTQNVGAEVSSALQKVAITPRPMLSLDKCHTIEEVSAFVGGDHRVTAMVKADGVSVRLKYKNGVLISANTRGNGYEGTDITKHIAQFLNVPLTILYQGEYIIDGEAIIKESDFKQINTDNKFKNPRNTVAGTLNLLDIKEVANRRLSFIAWDVIQGDESESFHERLEHAGYYGFEVIHYIPDAPLQDIVNDNLMRLAKLWGIPCDGVVWKFDSIPYGESLGATSHHFKNAIAWKPGVEIVESELKYINWTMGRTGVLTPVAVFEPVELDGREISRASLHNLSILKEKLGEHPYIGQKVWIGLANMIIPQIMFSEKTNQ